MPIRAIIGSLEVVCDTLEELDRLVERYGGGTKPAPSVSTSNGGGPSGVDASLLRAFVTSPAGVPSQTIAGMLGVQGKAIPNALEAWAARVHLSFNGIDKANPGGRRGWKLNEGGRDAAKVLLSGG